MIDKKVVTGDFKGVKRGMLVRLTASGGHSKQGDVALVLDTVLITRVHERGVEYYDPMLVILNRSASTQWPVDFIEVVQDEHDD